MTQDSVPDFQVVFTPSGRRGRLAEGLSVLEAARKLGVDLDSVCGGRGICGRCQIRVGEGQFAKHGITSGSAHVSEPNKVEARYDEKRGLMAGCRLGCQARIEGDLVIDVPAESQVHRQVVRKRADARQIEVDPVVRLHYVEVREPDMHEPSGDFRRLSEALKDQWQLDIQAIDLPALKTLQEALRKGKWTVTAAIRDEREVIGVWPGFKERIAGLAVDIGSTTVAAHLCDLASAEVLASVGAMNPQIRFGEDLMSRVSYVMMNPGGEAEMTAAVRDCLNRLAAEAATEAGIDVTDIVETVLVGNPVMHHLVLGLNPVELGGAPFALATDEAIQMKARDLDLKIHPGGGVYVLPCIAGHVGADAAAVTLCESPYVQDRQMLVVDVGTNAEIVLGNRDRLLACSSPTGPAFEGAQISAGQRAAPGAIERVRVDKETLEPRFRVIGSDLWSDEPGFAEATAPGGSIGAGVTGICGSGIIEVIAELFLAGVLTEDGVVNGEKAAVSPRIRADGRTFSYILHEGNQEGGGQAEIAVTQNDIRAIQLAKAALYAGARLLMDKLQIDTPETIRLAGAFGSHIEPKYAMVLGMIPDCPLDEVQSAGNAAGTGARIALLNKSARAEIEQAVRRIEKIETAVEPMFQQHFVEAMALPHKTAPYANLSTTVELPPKGARPESGEGGGGRRRRRRG